jgi:hypothetical protein
LPLNTRRVISNVQHAATPTKPMKKDNVPRNTIDAPSVKEFNIKDVIMRRWITRILGEMSVVVAAGAVMVSVGGVALCVDEGVRSGGFFTPGPLSAAFN